MGRARRLQIESAFVRGYRPAGPLQAKVGRRAFLAGAAGAVVGASAVVRAAKFSGKVEVKSALAPDGRVRRVSVGFGGVRWTIDTALFDGNPLLTVDTDHGVTRVRFSGARLPGTAFKVAYEAVVRPSLAGPVLSIHFQGVGVGGASWSAGAPLGAWIRGEVPLEAPLERRALQALVGGPARPLASHASGVVSGAGTVAFEPDHSFAIDAPTRLVTDGRTLPLASMTLRPCPKSGESLVTTPRRPFTVLAGPGAGDCLMPVDLASDGLWSIGGDVGDLEEVRLELHGDRAGLLVAGRGACAFESSAGPGLALALSRPRVAKILGTPHHVLAADFGSEGAWLDLGGCGLEVGAGPGGGGVFAQIDSAGEAHLDLDASMRRFSAGFEDAVVAVRSTDPQPLELTIQRQIPPPTRQVPPPRQVPPTRPVPPPGRQGPPVIANPGNLSRVQIRPGLIQGLLRLPFRIDVVRREDMLALSFEFINLSLQVGSGAPRLVRADATKPAYLIVTFPSQSLAEHTYEEDNLGAPVLNDIRPVPTRLSGPTRLVFFVPSTVPYIVFNLKGEDGKGKNGLLDWSKLRPNVVPTAVSPFGSNPRLRIDPGFTNPLERVRIGRLGMPPPEEPLGIVASIGGLLARRGGEPQDRRIVAPPVQRLPKVEDQLGTLAPNLDPSLILRLIPASRMPIAGSPYYTSIEMPVRLYLSPNELSGWAHRADVFAPGNRAELWHTRLGVQQLNGVKEGPTAVRAVDSVDYEWPDVDASQLFPVKIPSQMVESNQAMMRRHRHDLVDNMTHRELAKDSKPFPVEKLFLTPLGAYLKGEGTWDEVWSKEAGWGISTLITWAHRATLGRDHYVKIVERGYLHPTGHPAALVQVSERKVQQTPQGPVVAFTRKKYYVIVRVPKLSYNAVEQRELGFASLECLTVETPPLNISSGAIQPGTTLFWISLTSGPFLFNMRGVDVEGRQIEWSMPMIFVRYDTNAGTYQSRFNAAQTNYMGSPDGQPARRHKAFGQKAAFAPDDTGKGSTAFPLEELFFSATWTGLVQRKDYAGFRCVLHTAKVKVQSLQYMTGAENGSVEVAIPQQYKQQGFGGTNTAKAFLGAVKAVDTSAGSDTTRTGGLVNLDQKISAFVKGKGPVGGMLPQVLGGNSRPEDFMPDTLKILGAVSLWKLLPDTISITPGNPNDPNTLKSPRLEVKFEKDAGGVPIKAKVEFRWYPEVNSWPISNPPKPSDTPLLVIPSWSASSPALSLVGDVGVDLKTGKGDYSFVGSFKGFKVDCIAPVMSFIILEFDELKFEAKAGASPAVTLTPQFPKTTFTGPLTFVQKLQDLIKSVISEPEPYLLASTHPVPARPEGFEFTPFFDLQAGVIRVGFKLGVPTIGVGVLTIMNISLTAEVRLPLIGSALRVRFAFCERESPFRLTVMGIGGGGFMGIELGPEDVELLEASLEFGAAIALDIGVASGSVSLMAGIYYKLEAKKSTLSGYVRLVGKVSVLGIVRISIEFYLELTYEFDTHRCFGTASVTVEIEVLFFSFSVSMTVQKEFAGGDSSPDPLYASIDPAGLPMETASSMTFTQAVTKTDWETTYIGAFA